MDYEYDVAFSFAGEDREFVEAVFDKLEGENVKVFYDKAEEVSLWGKDLYTHLKVIYSEKARFIIPFISKSYKEKIWTKHELKSANQRQLETDGEYILPYKIDETNIESIFGTLGYVSNKTPSQLAELILRKLYASAPDHYPEPELEIEDDEDFGFYDYLESSQKYLAQGNSAVVEFQTCMSKMTNAAEELKGKEKSSKILSDFGNKLFMCARELDVIRGNYLSNIKKGTDYAIKSVLFVIEELPQEADDVCKVLHATVQQAYASFAGLDEAILATIEKVKGIPKLKKEVIKAKRELINVMQSFENDTKEILVLLQILINLTTTKKGDS